MTGGAWKEFRAQPFPEWVQRNQKLGPNTTKRKHERLVGFFNFCIANDWLEKNPAARMKRVEEKRVPPDYFTREEFERIVDATYGYGDWQGGTTFTVARTACIGAPEENQDTEDTDSLSTAAGAN